MGVYPRGMGGNQGQPSQGEPSSLGQGSSAPQERDRAPGDPDERLGPVTIARHLKADGRALILYTVDRQPSR
jgi:hypothetical protein